jgi:hypothetical protein
MESVTSIGISLKERKNTGHTWPHLDIPQNTKGMLGLFRYGKDLIFGFWPYWTYLFHYEDLYGLGGSYYNKRYRELGRPVWLNLSEITCKILI